MIDPRGVLREFGTELADDVEVRVWDSTAELRYLVLPERPAGTESLSEERLAALVTRDSMIGVAKVTRTQEDAMNGVHDMGGMHGMGPDRHRTERARCSMRDWEAAGFRHHLALGFHGRWNIDAPAMPERSRHPRLPQQQLLRALADGLSSGSRSIAA